VTFRVEPLPLSEIDDPELRDLIVKAEALGVPGSEFASARWPDFCQKRTASS
jgi:hypothetical protein